MALHFHDRRVLNNQIEIGKKALGNIDRVCAPVAEWPCLLNATHADTSLQFFSRAAAFAFPDRVSHPSGPNALCCCRACALSRRKVALRQSFALFLAVLVSMPPIVLAFQYSSGEKQSEREQCTAEDPGERG